MALSVIISEGKRKTTGLRRSVSTGSFRSASTLIHGTATPNECFTSIIFEGTPSAELLTRRRLARGCVAAAVSDSCFFVSLLSFNARAMALFALFIAAFAMVIKSLKAALKGLCAACTTAN